MNILLWLLILVCVGILAWSFIGFGRSDRLGGVYRHYHFSFFFTMSFIGFILPQLIGLSNEAGSSFASMLPEGALDILTFVAITCVLACFAGDIRGINRPSRAVIINHSEYDVDRLVFVAFCLMLGSVAVYQVGMTMVSQEQLLAMNNQFTGTITIIIFFTTMQKYGLALSILLFIRYRSALALCVALLGTFSSVYVFLSSFRRASAADLIFIVIFGLYFGRRFILPGWLLGLILTFGAIWSNSIGHFRSTEDISLFQKLQEVDLLGEFNNTIANGGHEVTNAAMTVWCADNENEFDFGRVHWNQLIHGYFPGQIFGAENKLALKFAERNLPLERFNYRPPLGVTSTGLSDAFCSFSYFGCIKYYVIGLVMGRWWQRGNRGDLRAQLAYMSLMGAGLHTISHGTFWLMNSYIHMVIFAYPCLWWARRPPATDPILLTPRQPVLKPQLHLSR